MIRIPRKYYLLTSYAIIYISMILISSCSREEEPNTYPRTEDTYIITFAGDRDKFKGVLQASTISEICLLSSSSFENKSYNQFSDSKFEEVYELKLQSIDVGQPKTVLIHCAALCFSDDNLSMECVIYKLAYDGFVAIKDKVFSSYPKGSHPSSDEYSFTIEL